MTAGLTALAGVVDTIDEHARDLFMSAEASRRLTAHTEEFLTTYTRLGNMADRMDLLLFPAVPKLHWMWHMARRSWYLSPRLIACFIDEGWLRHIKRIAARSVSGTAQHLVPKATMGKYRFGMGLQKL